jgi:aromatic-L-amino-acid decarboxylase
MNNDETELESLNSGLKDRINNSGKAYITHTKLGVKYCLRIVTAQTYTNEADIDKLWQLILEKVDELNR